MVSQYEIPAENNRKNQSRKIIIFLYLVISLLVVLLMSVFYYVYRLEEHIRVLENENQEIRDQGRYIVIALISVIITREFINRREISRLLKESKVFSN